MTYQRDPAQQVRNTLLCVGFSSEYLSIQTDFEKLMILRPNFPVPVVPTLKAFHTERELLSERLPPPLQVKLQRECVAAR